MKGSGTFADVFDGVFDLCGHCVITFHCWGVKTDLVGVSVRSAGPDKRQLLPAASWRRFLNLLTSYPSLPNTHTLVSEIKDNTRFRR